MEVRREGSSRPCRGRGRRRSGERDILIEGAIMGSGRNLLLEKFSGTQKDGTAKTFSNSTEGF